MNIDKSDAALAQPAPVGEDETGVREGVKVVGVSRMFDNDRAVLISLRNKPSDDQLRAIHDGLRSLANQPPKAETPAGVGDYDWKGAYECMAARNVDLGARLNAALAALSAAPVARPGDGVERTLHPRENPMIAQGQARAKLCRSRDCGDYCMNWHAPHACWVKHDPDTGLPRVLAAAPAADGGRATGWHDIAADEARMVAWVTDRFGRASQTNRLERVNRLFEGVVEIHQAIYAKLHLPADGEIRANAIVTHVYGKEPGEPAQEMGGVMTCALALAANLGVPLDKAAKAEIARIEGLSKEHFDKRHQAKVDAGVAAQHDRPAVSAEVEARARRIAAKMCIVDDPSGASLPDDIWRQAIPRAQTEIDFDI